MQLFIFGITYPFIWLISRLPMFILYFFSDIFFYIIYYLIGYRKEVVKSNLQLVFPNKSNTDINLLTKRFFKHFIDLVFESVKAFSISEKEILKRYKYKNPELINNLAKEGKSIALVGAHQANWEWSISLPLVLNISVTGAYTKLGNKYYDKVLKESRTKFGVLGVKTSDTVKRIQYNYKNNIQSLYILLSDQSPQIQKTHYWANFLGVKVPVHTGAEMLAKKYNLTVVNYITKKVKRGYFETEFELISTNAKEFENYELTDKYLAITKKNILKQPAFYLWTHKRFKHKDKYQTWLNGRKKA